MMMMMIMMIMIMIMTASQARKQGLRRSGRQRKVPDVLNLHTLTEETYDRTEYALITGDAIDNIRTGRLGEVGYMLADLPTMTR